jgi:hypothetical protein
MPVLATIDIELILKLSAVSCGESSILWGTASFVVRSLTPQQAAGNALATEFQKCSLKIPAAHNHGIE